MKIQAQFLLIAILFGAVLLIIATSVTTTTEELGHLDLQIERADHIGLAANDLNYLANQYLLYGEPQQLARWKERYTALGDDLSNLSPRAPDQQALVSTIRDDRLRMKNVFDEIVAARSARGTAPPDTAFLQTSWSRMSIQTQGIAFEAARLEGLLRNEANQMRLVNTLLIAALLGTFAIVLLVNYFVVGRRVLTSISTVLAGAKTVGSGDLDHPIPVTGDDEVGDLARAFNRMTADLKAVTASRADLEQEMAERRRAEATLKEYAAELEASNEELERFAYVASHDLQEPLRSIVSFSQLLERRYKGQLDQDADDFIGFIVEGGNRMQTLIQDLLQFSRITTMGNPPVETDAGEVLDHVLRDHTGAIESAGATVTVGPMPRVMADRFQLEQVFSNLIGNALKYRRPDVPPEVRVSAERRGDRWEFSVADNGIGIEAEYYDRIFVIFQRLHTREVYPGTGIGLAVVKKIVDRHGGTVRVESRPGEGSAFFFTLPAA